MIKKETMEAPKPMAMVTMPIALMVEENPSFRSLLILFDMKYERFNWFDLTLASSHPK
jgi:hypothetical protein